MLVNGKVFTWKAGLNVTDLLELLDYSYSGIIVSIDGGIVNKEDYGVVYLQEWDVVKVIHPICGG